MQGLLEPATARAILWPTACHLGLVVALYGWLSAERAVNVLRGGSYRDLATPGGDRGRAVRVAANLGNQFEAPALFYPLALALFATERVVVADILLAWVFVAGRLLHTAVQTLTTNVPLRGAVFSISFIAIIGLWLRFLASVL